MQEMVLISEVAHLSKEIKSLNRMGVTRSPDDQSYPWDTSLATLSDGTSTLGDTDCKEFDLHASTKIQLINILGEWEEPEVPLNLRKVIQSTMGC